MKIDIEKFIGEKGKEIAENIFLKYGEDPVIEHKSALTSFWDSLLGGSATRRKVEGEVYERSLQEATKFFLNNTEAKFDEKILKTIRSYYKSRAEDPKKANALSQEQLLANTIKFEAINLLLDKGLTL
jgi:hypothetical protein